MADVSVLFSLLAENNMSGPVAAATADLDKLSAAGTQMGTDMEAGAAKADAAMADTEGAAAKSSEGVIGSLKGVAEAMGVFEGFEFLKSSVESAESADKVYAQTNTILQSTGDIAGVTADQVSALADKYGELAGVQGVTVQNSLNTLLRSSGVQDAIKGGVVTTDQLTGTLVNMAAAMSKGGDTSASLGTAADALSKALADPYTAAKALTAAGDPLTASQVAQIAAFKKAGDEAGAYQVVLSSLESSTAGAAAANTTPLQQLSAEWADLKVQIGEQLIPIVDALAKDFQAALPDIKAVLDVLVDGINFVASHGDVFGPIAAGILAAVVAFKAITTAMEIYEGVMGVVEAIQAIFTGEELATDAALAANPIVLVIAALVGLGVAFYEAYEHSATFRNGVNDVLHAVGGAVSWLAGVFEDLWSVVESVWDWIVSKIQSAVGLIQSALSPIMSAINAVSSAASGIGGVIGSVGSFLGFAAGGTVGQGGYAIVGENGPELVALPGGSQVIPNGAATKASASTSVKAASGTLVASPIASAQGGGNGMLTISVQGNSNDIIVQMLRKYIRANGGDVQTVLGR